MTNLFFESPVENALMCMDLAPQLCHGCSNYHLGAIMRRATLPSDQRTADHREFSKAVSDALIPFLGSVSPVRIVIAGTTDTGLYTDVLNAAVDIGGPDFARSLSLTIVDRCQTPLTICGNFAEKFGLEPQLQCLNFLDFNPGQCADLVLLHGVLSFIPAQERLATLRHIKTWMNAGNVLISSTQMGHRYGDEEAEHRMAHATANLERFMTEHGIDDAQRRERLAERLMSGMSARNRHAELFADAEEATRLYEKAGLTVETLTWIDNDKRSVQGLKRRYSARAVATCRSHGSG